MARQINWKRALKIIFFVSFAGYVYANRELSHETMYRAALDMTREEAVADFPILVAQPPQTSKWHYMFQAYIQRPKQPQYYEYHLNDDDYQIRTEEESSEPLEPPEPLEEPIYIMGGHPDPNDFEVEPLKDPAPNIVQSSPLQIPYGYYGEWNIWNEEGDLVFKGWMENHKFLDVELYVEGRLTDRIYYVDGAIQTWRKFQVDGNVKKLR